MPRRPSKKARPPRVPSYCHHRASGQAYVKVRGKVTYLGVYGSEASRTAYAAAVAAILSRRPVPIAKASAAKPHVVTVREVCDRFTEYAQGYYVKAGKVTAEAGMVTTACGHAAALLGDLPAEAFGPLSLKSVRERMVASGLARSTVNQQVNRLRRAFRWAAGEELIPATVAAALDTVPGLRAGRTTARETAPVLPVADDVIEATIASIPAVVADMVRLQRLTAMRPGEVCDLRPCDVDRTAEVWTYRPASHKTQHHGRERVVILGPKAQAILLRYLARSAKAYCFSPADSEAKRRAEVHAARTTPLSCGNRPGTNRRAKPSRAVGDKYTTTSYARAIARGCEATWPAPEGTEGPALREWNTQQRWSPNQLRHTAATEIRARFGLEASQVILGHSAARTSEIYAEKNLAAGVVVAQAIG